MSGAAAFFRQRPGLSLLYLFLALLLSLRALAHAWLLPPYVWDTLVYHLPRLAEWVQHHGLFVVDTSIDRLYWPANFELFQCWFVIFFHHDFIVELAGVFPYALAVLSVYSISRSFGAPAAKAGIDFDFRHAEAGRTRGIDCASSGGERLPGDCLGSAPAAGRDSLCGPHRQREPHV
jgi:hypothetical protein